MKLNLIFFVLIFFAFGHSASAQDHLQDKVYNGYRVYLAKIKEVDKNDKHLKIAYQAINTGRQDLQFGKDIDQKMAKDLIVKFSVKFSNGPLSIYRQDIVDKLLQEDFQIVAGKIAPVREMKIPVKKQPLAKTTESTPAQTESQSPILDKSACPDLRIEAIKVLKQSKRSVTIEYTIKNIGKGPASISGRTKKENDNMAVKAYMTSSSKLTKGALVLGGDFVKGFKNNAPLQPNENLTTTIKLNISEMTKFTPVVILELDTFGQIQECDETNNLNYIQVK